MRKYNTLANKIKVEIAGKIYKKNSFYVERYLFGVIKKRGDIRFFSLIKSRRFHPMYQPAGVCRHLKIYYVVE